MTQPKTFRKQLILLLLFVPCLLMAQQPLQKGKITEQNSGKKGIGNVQIQVMGASAEVSDQDGNFRLNLVRHHPGQLVFVDKIEKKGYSVVNKTVVDQWLFAPDKEFHVIMCPTAVLESNIEKYYKIGSINYKERFNTLKQKIEQEKAQKIISEQEFDKQYAALVKTLNKEMELLTGYSDLFARINKDDLSLIEKQAFGLLDQGKLGEAVRLYEAQKYLDKFSAQVNVEKSMEDAISQLIPSLKNNADLYIFAGGAENYAKAEKILRSIALSDTTSSERVKPYLSFLVDQELYEDAEKWCGILYRNTASLSDKAEVMNTRGVISNRMKDPANVEKHYLAGIDLINQALETEQNPYYHLQKCITYCNMARYYNIHQKNIMANKYVEMAIAIGEPLALQYKGKYTFGVAMAYSQKGTIECMSNFPEKSIESSMKALTYLTMVHVEEPQKVDYIIALVNNTIATAYSNLSKYDKAKEYANIAVEMMRKLAGKGLAMYNYELANLLSTLGLIYYQEENFAQALLLFEQSVNLYKETGLMNPVHIERAVVSIENLAMSYRKTANPDKAEQLILQALTIYKEYLKIDYLQVAPSYANLLCNYASSKRADKNYKEALTLLQQAYTIYEQLDKMDSGMNMDGHALCANLLATVYSELGNRGEAEAYYLKSDAMYDNIKRKGEEIPAFTVANSCANIAVFFDENQKRDKAIKYYKKAINMAVPYGKIVSDQCTELAVTCAAICATDLAKLGKGMEAHNTLRGHERFLDSIRNERKRETNRIFYYESYRTVNEMTKIATNEATLVSRLITSYEYLIKCGEDHYQNLGLIRQEQGQSLFDQEKYSEAIPYFIKAAELYQVSYAKDQSNEPQAILLLSCQALAGFGYLAVAEFDPKKTEFKQGMEMLEQARKLALRFPKNEDAREMIKTMDDLLK